MPNASLSIRRVIDLTALYSEGYQKCQLVITLNLVHNGVTNVSPFYTIRMHHENS